MQDLHEDQKIPNPQPSYEEIAKQMRINADCLMQEITEHAAKQTERAWVSLNLEICSASEKHISLNIPIKKEDIRIEMMDCVEGDQTVGTHMIIRKVDGK